ncbi:PAS domain-containing protein [Methylobacterium sp. J-067]|uniref:PAS domain-containing protein n=1 Tax=Methylobacterium sp. J-067 TaxID=2836648 RepID=UPI001FB98B1C|nr:PAS domain-containing protein [Methylobacterium sp. J-067]MCJ2023437.1 PAS domain-containing protein [Methylobacterium sp. J-067]
MPNYTEEARIIRELTRAGSGPDPFSSAVRATRMPMLITDPRRDDNPIVFANAAFARLTGHDRDAIIGRNCRFLQGPETDRADVARLRQAIEGRVPIELELLNYRRDGSTFWNRLLVSPVFGEDGELTYFFASQFDVTLERERLVRLQRDRDDLEAEVAQCNVALQASEERLRFALDAGQLGSWSLNLETGHLTASDSCKVICGRQPGDPFTLAELQASIHPDDRAVQRDAIERAIANRSLLDAEYRLTTPAGQERWVQIRGRAHYRADGTPLLITGTSQDITDRRAIQSQRALLTRELHHRVQNTLASLQAIVAQTMRRASSIEDAAATLTARIQAMAAANTLLITEDFGSVSMRDLVKRSLAPFGVEDAERFRLSGPDLRLPPQVVVAYALALHELATNATKYGALSNAAGVVEVAWSLTGQADHPLLHMIWREHGGPPVKAPRQTNFGTQLIKRVLATEIGGRVDVDYRVDGVVFTAVAPLANAIDGNRHSPSK